MGVLDLVTCRYFLCQRSPYGGIVTSSVQTKKDLLTSIRDHRSHMPGLDMFNLTPQLGFKLSVHCNYPLKFLDVFAEKC